MSRWNLAATLSSLVFIAGCGGSTKPDVTPPATVSDLSVILVHDSSATLTWTAPGDDGLKGRAAGYDLRVATFSVVANWNLASRVIAPVPGLSGETDSAVVSGLDAGVSYNFALRAVDDAGNWSDISNMAEGVPVDTIPPAPVTDLAARLETPISVTLSWTAPGDDGQVGMPFSYDVRYATEPLTEATWGTASVADVPIAPSVAGAVEEMTIWPLQNETVYYFALKTTDERENTSGLSNVAEIETGTTHVWRILPDGTGDAPTVQAGIDSAGNGDLVLVEPGTYYENINLKGKDIWLTGHLGAPATTLTGANGDSSVIVCNAGETNRTVIEGFTITGGKGVTRSTGGRYGGGILCINSSPTIRDNIIQQNTAVSTPGGSYSWGGGIYFASDTGVTIIIEDNVIQDNFASSLAGGVSINGHCVIRGNTIARNYVQTGDGGGMWIGKGTAVTIEGNFVLQNQAGDHGGGLVIADSGNTDPSSKVISRNVFVGNRSLGLGQAIDCTGGAMWVSGAACISENTISFNHAWGLYPPNGGGICLIPAGGETSITRNIIYDCSGGGIIVFSFGRTASASVTRNILFANEPDIVNRSPEFVGLDIQDNLFVDPELCVQDSTSLGGLAATSPALSQPFGVIGAISQPECGGQ